MDLHKIGIRVLAEETGAVALQEFIPVFHAWIQGRLLDGLLIDVADYSHVPDGPGILLVAHDGNYAYDETGGRRGLVYYSKQALPGALPERLAAVCHKALAACALIESNDVFKGRVRFHGHRLEIFANDRLLAPNTEQTFDALRSPVEALLNRLFPQRDYVLAREPDGKERFSLAVTAGAPATVLQLTRRLAA